MAKVIYGTAGDNQLNATDKSQVYGGAGNDTLLSDGKREFLLVGGSGDDILILSGGAGSLSGGAGSDTFEFVYSAEKKISAVIEDFDPTADKIRVHFDGSDLPKLSSAQSGNDVVWSSGDGNFNLTLKSIRENDYFDGETSDDVWKVLELTNAALRVFRR